jgi:uncharacterized membrane protein
MPRLLRRWYPLLLAAIGAGASLLLYDRLPVSVAVHWNVDGAPDGWAPRAVGAAMGPVFLLVLWAVLRLAPRLSARVDDSRFAAAYESIVAATLLLVLATHGIVLAVALGLPVAVERVVPALAGVLFLVVGNVMPIARPTWWFGVRTPWSLADERVWVRTHRLAGLSMTGAGLVMLLAAIALPARLGAAVVVGAAVASVVGPAVYSYLTWRRERER